MAKIENHKFTVQDAFRDNFYSVPDYQREYVWGEKEIGQLLEDIDEQLQAGGDREYFVGMVLVAPRGESGHFDIIDGQQRLTTFYLILCALRDRLGEPLRSNTFNGLVQSSYTDKEGNSIATLRLAPRYDGAMELMNAIVGEAGSPDEVRSRIKADGLAVYGSLGRLIEAYDLVHGHLGMKYPTTEALKRFWGFLANEVVFIQISTDVSSALKIFETINERGVGLDPMDLLKNLLFSSVPRADFARLKNEWKQITAPLEKKREKPLRFLRYFLMAQYPIKGGKTPGIVREDEIYDWFRNSDNAAASGYKEQPFAFVGRIKANVDKYLEFVDGRGNDGKTNSQMESLQVLCGGGFSLHYILLLAAAGLPRPRFDYLVSQLESFLFYFIFTRTPTRDLERNFSAWADELREIVGESNDDLQAAALERFVRERFLTAMIAKRTELKDALNRYTLGTMQKYRTKYLLAKLAQHIQMAYHGTKVPGPLGDFLPLEIEHILPNTPENELRASWSKESPDLAYDDAKVRLGNLTLLEKPLNIIAGNSYFDLKLPEYKKSKCHLTSTMAELPSAGTNTSINRINAKLKMYGSWSAATIQERQEMLGRLAFDVWRTARFDGRDWDRLS